MQGTLWASQGCLFRTASSQSVRTYTSQLLRWFLIVDMRIIETSNVGWTTICKFRGVGTGLEVWGEHEFLNTTNHMGKTFVQIAAQFCFLELQAHKLSEKSIYILFLFCPVEYFHVFTVVLLCSIGHNLWWFVWLLLITTVQFPAVWDLKDGYIKRNTYKKKYLLFIERKVFCRK